MTDLEETLRERLAQLADEAETRAPMAQRARTARRRRVRRLAGIGAVAALVVTGAGIGAVVHRSTDVPPSGGVPSDRASDEGPTPLGGYRLEVWHDVAVYVPATWGWGGAPGACGVGPTVDADGHRLTAAERADGGLPGYVGRPIAQTPRCPQDATQDSGGDSGGDLSYAWLGADVPTGSIELADGSVQETREVAGVAVTVASPDAALREQILSSAHQASFRACPAHLDAPPEPGEQGTGSFDAISLDVCAYAPADGTAAGAAADGYRLLYGEELAAGSAEQLADAVESATPMGQYSCFGASGGEWALLHVVGDRARSRTYVVDLTCPSIADPTGLQHRLTAADVRPWAVGGVNAVLHGSPLIEVPGVLVGE